MEDITETKSGTGPTPRRKGLGFGAVAFGTATFSLAAYSFLGAAYYGPQNDDALRGQIEQLQDRVQVLEESASPQLRQFRVFTVKSHQTGRIRAAAAILREEFQPGINSPAVAVCTASTDGRPVDITLRVPTTRGSMMDVSLTGHPLKVFDDQYLAIPRGASDTIGVRQGGDSSTVSTETTLLGSETTFSQDICNLAATALTQPPPNIRRIP
jgi:hypothetical protein